MESDGFLGDEEEIEKARAVLISTSDFCVAYWGCSAAHCVAYTGHCDDLLRGIGFYGERNHRRNVLKIYQVITHNELT